MEESVYFCAVIGCFELYLLYCLRFWGLIIGIQIF